MNKPALAQELTACGALFGKHPAWANEVLPAFLKALANADDGAVRSAFEVWANDAGHERPPKPVEIRNLIRESNRSASTKAEGCCRDCFSGRREVAFHFTKRDGAAAVEVTMARCTCLAAAALEGPTFVDLIARWRTLPRMKRVVMDPKGDDRYHDGFKLPAPTSSRVVGPTTWVPLARAGARAAVEVDRRPREPVRDVGEDEEGIRW